jgi:hypothetical protein
VFDISLLAAKTTTICHLKTKVTLCVDSALLCCATLPPLCIVHAATNASMDSSTATTSAIPNGNDATTEDGKQDTINIKVRAQDGMIARNGSTAYHNHCRTYTAFILRACVCVLRLLVWCLAGNEVFFKVKLATEVRMHCEV